MYALPVSLCYACEGGSARGFYLIRSDSLGTPNVTAYLLDAEPTGIVLATISQALPAAQGLVYFDLPLHRSAWLVLEFGSSVNLYSAPEYCFFMAGGGDTDDSLPLHAPTAPMASPGVGDAFGDPGWGTPSGPVPVPVLAPSFEEDALAEYQNLEAGALDAPPESFIRY